MEVFEHKKEIKDNSQSLQKNDFNLSWPVCPLIYCLYCVNHRSNACKMNVVQKCCHINNGYSKNNWIQTQGQYSLTPKT